jgi:DNA-binding NtrC family response regulator
MPTIGFDHPLTTNDYLNTMPETILIADDDTSVITALHMLLQSVGFDVVAVTTPQALLEQVKIREYAVALIDLNYQKDTTSGQEGFALIEQIKQLDEYLPVVVMTGYSSVDIAVNAMKLGASDFIQKPWGNERLLRILKTQITLRKMQISGAKLSHENALLKNQIQQQGLSPSSHIVAQSPIMRQLLGQLERLAQSDMSILLTGENGTGKSLFAHYIHQQSKRKKQPFIAVNMGAITENLFESEMFGHIKGAFTDAKDNRIGRFELAESGSIFLDEIANISLNQQAKLLRVLEERQFEKVGSSKTQLVDIRLICATNADLSAMVADGQFRQDLLYRLNTVVLHIPSLQERQQDIIPLADAFLAKFATQYRLKIRRFSDAALAALQAYQWPGNIRELAHIIERAMFLSVGEQIELADLALPIQNQPRQQPPLTLAENWSSASLDEIEKAVIKQRLADNDNNPQATAESLGLSRSAYYRRLEKYQLS